MTLSIIQDRKLALLGFAILISSCGWNPNFRAEGMCVITTRGTSIVNLSITNHSTREYYLISRDLGADGKTEICLDMIPSGYTLRFAGDTISKTALEFAEGDTVSIDNSGGDRRVSDQFIVRNNKLMRIN
jgi:hypothetical protein